ncbi:MAG: prepilin-type N-terminal cleavage/methylation domain-containing protein [Patescibacteria group bacterium]
MKPSFQSQKGFTIVEALISVLMLALVIGAVSGLVQRSLATNQFSKEQVIANYLAGEAIEYVRNIRDSNYVAGRAWFTGLSHCMGTTCRVDTVNNSITPCSETGGSDRCKLRFVDDTSTGYYSYNSSGTTDSNYIRTVELRPSGDAGGTVSEVAIVVTISGERGVFSQIPLVVVEHLNNWGGN